MRGRFWTCSVAVAAAAVVVAPIGARADVAATAAPVRTVPVDSNYETVSRSVSRDVGISAALPGGQDLWLFGDTGIFQRNNAGDWKETRFIDGSSALVARYKRGHVPRGKDYPSGVPARLIPVPRNVYLPDGSGRLCNQQAVAFAARWPTGATVVPTNKSQVLVTYGEVCVTQSPGGNPTIRAEGWGYMLYNWQTHRIVRGPVDVFKPQRSGAELGTLQIFKSPRFKNGQLTLFSSQCAALFVGCSRGQVWSVTMPATKAAMGKTSSYRLHRLVPAGSAQWQPLTVSIGRYSTGLRLVEMTSIAGDYKIFTAAKVGAPWHLHRTGVLPGCPTHTSFCFALEGHPELSTSTETFVSYMDPDATPVAHVVLSAIPNG